MTISVIVPDTSTDAFADAYCPSPVITTVMVALAGSYPEPPFPTLITSTEPTPAKLLTGFGMVWRGTDRKVGMEW